MTFVFCFIYAMEKYINIPIKLIKSAKTDKRILELIAFAYIIKLNYKSSCLKKYTVNNVARLCHCSKEKAKTLINLAVKNTTLFSVSKDGLTAKSFKHYRDIRVNKFHQEIYAANVLKLRNEVEYYDKEGNKYYREFKLRDVVKKLREALFLNVVNGFERKDKLSKTWYDNNFNYSLCGTQGFMFTQKHIANTLGVKRNTAVRIVKSLNKAGTIKIYRGGIDIKSTANSDDALKELGEELSKVKTSQNQSFCFIMIPNSYEITDRRVTNNFCHIIYGHKKRLTESNKIQDEYEKYIDR